MRISTLLAVLLAAPATMVLAQQATFQTKSLTPETALVAAKAALEACRKQGYQVGVAVVDRAGITQVFLRDRFAGPHTVDVAINKAWTAASFRTSTLALATETQAGRPMSGIRAVARFTAVGGGVLIEGGGSSFGAIGVSGAPGGEADEVCANAGIKAIADSIEF
ncbi:MAG: heme-binding protein [Burkholderiaceae bacterium]|nr:heme-binding protein [Burkholderiaceae bacterium]MBP7661987.1 heme-binding protein [Burkholderiaceae bacterium]